MLSFISQEDLQISEVLPFQNNCTPPSRTLTWINNTEPKTTPLPMVIIQECLISYIKKQVHDSDCLLYNYNANDA